MPKYKVMTVKLLVKAEDVEWDVSEALNNLRDDGRLPIVEWVQEDESTDITEEEAAARFERPDLRPKEWRIRVQELTEHEVVVCAASEEEAYELAIKAVNEGRGRFVGVLDRSVPVVRQVPPEGDPE